MAINFMVDIEGEPVADCNSKTECFMRFLFCDFFGCVSERERKIGGIQVGGWLRFIDAGGTVR